ncbi:dihydrolipoyl dehydrogenase [Microbacterium sediminicola]|uniref:Dihydrolipoyl dehydrogenase n=1 Tax=Microbacterium sediminicola TaxID=415210 RepID=A0ABN2HST1_9MICO
MSDVDLLVLGGGSGGYAAALRAAELGMTVTLIEKDRVGGTCLHRGCVPTKALLHTADIVDTVRGAHHHGVDATLSGIDMAAALTHRSQIVSKKFSGLTGLLAARGITVIEGVGVLDPDGAVRVGEQRITATDTVIATGARTKLLPGITPGPRILTSDTALDLARVPESVVVLGGGVIGVEFASIWRSLGAQVTIVEPMSRLLPAEDEASSAALLRAFRKRGIDVTLGQGCSAATEHEDRVTITLSDGSELSADVLLLAVGREPATSDLGLEAAGVKLDRGFVMTDDALRASAPHVWAVGDVVPGPQLAHRGFAHGIFVAETIAGLAPAPLDDNAVPRVAYSNPEVASIGLTEAAATERYGTDAIATAQFSLAANAKSEILGTSGFVKVIRRIGGPVIGVHMVGARVGELIGEAQTIVGWEAHPEDVAPLLHAHPTQGEALGEAMLMLAGKPLHAR